MSPRPSPDRIALFGLAFDAVTMDAAVERVARSVGEGAGGLVLTANLDILRRSVVDADALALYARADLVVADGMPLVWASRIAGTPVPERVAGSTMLVALAGRAATDGRTVYLLGGDGDDGERAADELRRRFPALAVVGTSSPRVSMPPTDDEVASIARSLAPLAPDLVFVALGSPKQEALAIRLRESLPRTWFVGVGISLAFLSGRVDRAPLWAQRLGLEWAHRLGQEPTRLARRYLVDGLPFAVRLFAHALSVRAARARS